VLTVCLLGADGVSTPVPVSSSVPEEEVAVIAMLVV
jgi:hypothetical protein